MVTNIYLGTYPIPTNSIDDNIAHIAQSLRNTPLSYVAHYSLFILGNRSELTKNDLQRRLFDAIELSDTLVRTEHSALRHLIRYQDEFHGMTTQDGKQIYPIGMPRPDGRDLRTTALLELVTLGDILVDSIPTFREYHFDLTVWKFGYSRRDAESTLIALQGRLHANDLKVVSKLEDVEEPKDII